MISIFQCDELSPEHIEIDMRRHKAQTFQGQNYSKKNSRNTPHLELLEKQ